MDAGTLVVELVKAGAWPLTAFSVALMFRSTLSSLFTGLKLKRLKRGEWEADFQETLAEVRREVAALPASTGSPVAPPSTPKGGGEFATIAVVQDAWSRIESAIDDAARQARVAATTLPEKLRALGEKGILAAATVDSVNGLRILRNLTVHAPDRVPVDKIHELIEMANGVLYAINMNVKNARLTERDQP